MEGAAARRGIIVASAVVGFGAGGFFDGILLHQILQWHHLLSLVRGAMIQDPATQILADGLFHLLMYAVTAAGLWMLWRRRPALARQDIGWCDVIGGALLGFGLWNAVDAFVFHWIMGIHRIRVNVAQPLAYDLGWLTAFGVLPAALGWILLRHRRGDAEGGGRRAAASVALLVLLAAPVASLPIRGSNSALVFMRPGSTAGSAINLALDSGAPLLWVDPGGRMIAVRLENGSSASRLYRNGALLVSRSPVFAGCIAAVQA